MKLGLINNVELAIRSNWNGKRKERLERMVEGFRV